MKNKFIQTIGAGFAATTVGALAGDFSDTTTSVVEQSGGAGNWCEAIGNIGTLYKDKSNPWIQEVKVFGRAQYQWGYSDVDNFNDDYSGQGDEIRRLRAGLSVKFLNGFKALGRVNLEEGGFRNHEGFSYGGFDELYINYSAENFAGFENFTVGYGRYKIAFGGEEAESSKKIKTVERSNLNNIFAPSRATGALINGEMGDLSLAFGVFSSRSSDQDWADWNGGEIYFASAAYGFGDSELRADFIYNDADGSDREIIGYDWASSLTYNTEVGNFELMANATFGDMGDDNVYGVVLMPSTYLIEDRLEAVFRYQWAHSTGDSIRPNSRNLRNVAGNEFPSRTIGRGDDNHTFYAGLNYFICDHNAKVMLGAEYETLDGENNNVDLEATTLWAAFRMYF
ncbi:porin [Verrucomicrobiaceae bacterium 227]